MGATSDAAREKVTLSRAILRCIQLLIAIALTVDCYLAWVSISGSEVAGCGLASNCHTVLTSKWAYSFGFPVSAAALPVYGSLFVASFFLSSDRAMHRRRLAWLIVLALSIAVIGAAIWFIALQLIVLKTICPFCMTAHVCASAATALLLLNAPVANLPAKKRRSDKLNTPERLFVAPRRALGLGLGAVAGLAVLVAGQMLQHPKTYVTQTISAGATTNSLAPAVREFQIFDGQFRFNLEEVPLVGRVDAAHTILSLFDYTCHHCREMHAPLMQAQRQFSNQLAIVSLPMPLDGKCNPLIKRILTPHTNACALARVGLTVWRANRKASPKFDDWMFEPSKPPTPAAAEAYARQLIGSAAFDQAVTNAWIDAQIRQDVAVYEAVYRKFRKSSMPEIIIGTNLISGVVSHEQFFQMLSEQLGLKSDVPPPTLHP